MKLNSISLGGKKLAVSASVFDQGHGTIMDSGTTYLCVPTPVKQVCGCVLDCPGGGVHQPCVRGGGGVANPSAKEVFDQGHGTIILGDNTPLRAYTSQTCVWGCGGGGVGLCGFGGGDCGCFDKRHVVVLVCVSGREGDGFQANFDKRQVVVMVCVCVGGGGSQTCEAW